MPNPITIGIQPYLVTVTRHTTYRVLAESRDDALDRVLLDGEGVEVDSDTSDATVEACEDEDEDATTL